MHTQPECKVLANRRRGEFQFSDWHLGRLRWREYNTLVHAGKADIYVVNIMLSIQWPEAATIFAGLMSNLRDSYLGLSYSKTPAIRPSTLRRAAHCCGWWCVLYRPGTCTASPCGTRARHASTWRWVTCRPPSISVGNMGDERMTQAHKYL